MNSKTLFDQIVSRVALMETKEEVRNIAFLVIESKFGLSQTDVLTEKALELTDLQYGELNKIIERINTAEPIQYILGEAGFFGRKFIVSHDVLIPRPETEELVQTIIKHHRQHPLHSKPYRDYGNDRKQQPTSFRILDIGTGSGCIPITLKLEIPEAQVFATDIDEAAIEMALINCERLSAKVSISKHDILKEDIVENDLDVIVSNPPYIMESEKASLKRNVIDFEPHHALFVPTNDPLLFYKTIAEKGARALKTNGGLFVEVNEKLGQQVADLFKSSGYHREMVIQDLSNKPRIVTAIK